MSESCIVIGDCHGCLNTLKALIEKLPKEDQIIFTGDLIDRGTHSKEVVQLAIDNEFLCVLGNHEEMMWNPTERDLWLLNGGYNTLQSYGLSINPRGNVLGDSENLAKFKEHQEWMSKLPLYILAEDVTNSSGENLLVTHSSASRVWKWSEERKKEMSYHFKQHILWERNYNPHPIPGIFNVFGHTPHNEPKIIPGSAFIDTGAVFNGKLTALRFPEMEVYQQEFIE